MRTWFRKWFSGIHRKEAGRRIRLVEWDSTEALRKINEGRSSEITDADFGFLEMDLTVDALLERCAQPLGVLQEGSSE